MPPRLQVLPLTLGVVLLLGGCSGTSSPRSATPSSTKPASSPPVTASAPAPTQPPATSSPAALPAGFEPFSVSAVSASTGVVLGVQRGCGSGTCTRLLRTTDGFKTFTPVTPPPAPVVQGDPASIGISPGVNGAVSDIRLDAEGNEWAYGEVLWTKHGGGRWTKVPNVINVLDLEVSGGKAIALVCESVANQCGMGSSNLMRSPVNEDRFRDVGPSAENGGPGESLLAVSGQHVALLRPDTAGGGKRLLYLSDDGATTFRSREQELSIKSDVAIALTPTGTFCLFQHTPGEDGDRFSCPTGTETPPGVPTTTTKTAVTLSAVSSQRVVVAGEDQIGRTTNGRTFQPVDLPGAKPQTDLTFVGFTDDVHGFALAPGGGPGSGLWHTSDGGNTWTKVNF